MKNNKQINQVRRVLTFNWVIKRCHELGQYGIDWSHITSVYCTGVHLYAQENVPPFQILFANSGWFYVGTNTHNSIDLPSGIWVSQWFDTVRSSIVVVLTHSDFTSSPIIMQQGDLLHVVKTKDGVKLLQEVRPLPWWFFKK